MGNNQHDFLKDARMTQHEVLSVWWGHIWNRISELSWAKYSIKYNLLRILLCVWIDQFRLRNMSEMTKSLQYQQLSIHFSRKILFHWNQMAMQNISIYIHDIKETIISKHDEIQSRKLVECCLLFFTCANTAIKV